MSDMTEGARQAFKDAVGDIPAKAVGINTVAAWSSAGRITREPENAWIFDAPGIRIVYQIGDTYINRPSDVDNIVRAAERGTRLLFHLALMSANGPGMFIIHPHQMEITVEALPPAFLEVVECEIDPLFWMTLEDDLKDGLSMVKVTSVASGSPAWRAGIRSGAYILGKRLTVEQYSEEGFDGNAPEERRHDYIAYSNDRNYLTGDLNTPKNLGRFLTRETRSDLFPIENTQTLSRLLRNNKYDHEYLTYAERGPEWVFSKDRNLISSGLIPRRLRR